jgi:hypothetical protein
MNYRYFIAYLGQRKKFDRPAIANIVGFDKYTPDVMVELKKLFDHSIIESYPYKSSPDSRYLEWIDEDGQEHRENDLPSTEWENGERVWKIHGYQTRNTPNPSWIAPENSLIEWTDGRGNKLARAYGSYRSGYTIYDDSGEKTVDFETYKQFILKRFPGATKFKYEEYVPS